MPDAYATAVQLAAWLGDVPPPADADRSLSRASELLDSVVRCGFDVDADGIPTDTDIATAMQDAACAQVEFWQVVGEDTDIEGLSGQKVSVLGLSTSIAPELAPRADRILRVAGLMSVPAGAGSGQSTWSSFVEEA